MIANYFLSPVLGQHFCILPLPLLYLWIDAQAVESGRCCSWGEILWLYMTCLCCKFLKVPLMPERVKTNPWLSTEKCHKCFFTCSNNVRYSRMAAERVSLLSEAWYILKFLSYRCLANSIQTQVQKWCCSRSWCEETGDSCKLPYQAHL